MVAVSASTAATIAAAAAIASAGVGAYGAIQQGQQAAAQSRFQSAVMRQQAERERMEAGAAEDDFRRQQSRLFARRRALLGGTGVDPATGSPLLTSQDFAAETELQALRIRSGGQVRATRLEQSADLERMRGRNAQTGSYFRAGSLLLSGAGRAYGTGAFDAEETP